MVPQPITTAIHCINPDCSRPYPQAWGSRFCQNCGSTLLLRDRYVPLQHLGAGGFAITYTIYDLQAQQERVLKVLTETIPKALELFEQEAAVLASLNHPGVPQVEPNSYFSILVGNPPKRSLPCLVMEKIEGQTLQDVLDQHPQGCPEVWVWNWLHQAVDILQELHRRGIIHRDLKPANFMLRPNQQLVVIDFGGAKQIRSASPYSQASSTRLVSPGYSPPEQSAGGVIQPASDFYALGRTFIHLLTGQYPADLEDPATGKLKWRDRVSVTPALADLLDNLVHADIRQRPNSASDIQARLNSITPVAIALTGATARITPQRRQVAEVLFEASKAIGQGGVAIALSTVKAVIWVIRAFLDTLWSMILSATGGSIGATIGFWLAYWSPLGQQTAGWFSQQLQILAPDLGFVAGPEFWVFGLAGLGTAAGLTVAGGFGQKRRLLVAMFVGLLGYLLGWVGLQVAIANQLEPMTTFGAIAVFLLTLGLGLPSHHFIHALAATGGTTLFLVSLTALNPSSFADFLNLSTGISASINPSWAAFWASLNLFSFLGSVLGFQLGVSYYLLVPFLKWLGFR